MAHTPSRLGGDDLRQWRSGPAVCELTADLAHEVDELDDEWREPGVVGMDRPELPVRDAADQSASEVVRTTPDAD